jgi:DNA-binding transcriptional MerR regulator
MHTQAKTDTFAPEFFLIGELAEQTGLSPTAIRFYEREGLIAPKRHGRFRVYLAADAERLKLIVQMRSMGLPIKIIGRLVRDVPEARGWSDHPSVRAALAAHKQDLIRQQRDVDRQLAALSGLLDARTMAA